MDTGGGEYYQIYYYDLKTDHYKLLTDGHSLNHHPLWSHQGHHFAFSSTARNGRDHDIYLHQIDTADNPQLLCHVQGYWMPVAWSKDDTQLLV